MDFKKSNLKSFNKIKANNNDIYEKYLADISKYKPLSKEEEDVLFTKYKEGDNSALEKICRHNLLFVVSVARYYSSIIGSATLTLEDLISEGNVGIWIAAKRFDPLTNNKFLSYGVWWIKQCILASISENMANVRLPHHVSNSINKIKKAEVKLEQRLGRNVTTEELFASILENGGIKTIDSEAKMIKMLAINKNEASLDSFVDEETQMTLGDTIRSDDEEPDVLLERKERVKLVIDMLENLPIGVKEYFYDFYGINGAKQLSIDEIAIKYDEKPPYIRFKIERALRRLRLNNINLEKSLFPTPDYDYLREVRKIGVKTNTRILI